MVGFLRDAVVSRPDPLDVKAGARHSTRTPSSLHERDRASYGSALRKSRALPSSRAIHLRQLARPIWHLVSKCGSAGLVTIELISKSTGVSTGSRFEAARPGATAVAVVSRFRATAAATSFSKAVVGAAPPSKPAAVTAGSSNEGPGRRVAAVALTSAAAF